MRFSTILKLAGIGALLLIVALVQVVKSIDANAYRDVLAQAARQATGRELQIKGKLSLQMSLTPALVANEVSFANAAWGSRPAMVTVERLEADIGLLPLLMREVRVGRLILSGVDILLERDGKGRANWDFGPAAGQSAPPSSFTAGGTPTNLKIAQIRLDNAQVVYKDGSRVETLHIDRLTAQADHPTAPVGLSIGGSWNNRHFDISGVLGRSGDLVGFGKPYPVKLKAVLPGLVATANGNLAPDRAAGLALALDLTAEATEIAEAAKLAGFNLPLLGAGRVALTLAGPWSAPRVTALDAVLGRRDAVALTLKGSINNLMAVKGVDLLLAAEGDNIAGFNKPLDLSLPVLGPVKLAGHLTDGESGWRLADFRFALGHSDLAGDAQLRLAGPRPLFEAHLASANLDLTELTSSRGAAAKGRAVENRVFGDEALPFRWLATTDADLSWKIDRMVDEGLAASRIDLSATLKDGRLAFTPKIGSLASGSVAGTLTVDGSGKQPSVRVELSVDKVGLGEVLKGLSITPALHGAPTDLRISLKGSGGSLRSIMARLNGETAVVVGKGRIEGTNADMLAFDVIRQLAAWRHDTDTDMQCLVSRFAIAEGMARSEALLFDTSEMTVAGQGSINLANEDLDLTLSPKPKEASLVNLAVPLDISGSLAHPSVAPNKGAIVKGMATAVGAVALGPFGALLPLITAGASDGNPCLAALAQPKKPPPARKPVKGAGSVR